MHTISSILVIVEPTVERDFVIDKAKSIVQTYKLKITFFISNAAFLAPLRYIYDSIRRQIYKSYYEAFVSKSILF